MRTMPSPRRLAPAATLLALLTAAPAAHADDPDEAACAAAAEESQSLRQAGKLVDAREKAVLCGRSSCPASVQRDCAVGLTEIELSLPSVVIRAVDAAGKDVADVQVSVDDKVVRDRLDGRPLVLDPGEHVFTYVSPGAPPVKETLLVRRGEKERLVTVTLARGAVKAKPATDEEPEDRFAQIIPPASWALGIGGLVAGGFGALMWSTGKADHADMEASCAVARRCLQSDVADDQLRARRSSPARSGGRSERRRRSGARRAQRAAAETWLSDVVRSAGPARRA